MSVTERLRAIESRVGWAVLIDVAAIGAVLAAMLIANVEWAFSRPTSVDTWMYFGFFRHYDVSDYLAGNKKIARLPWILVGFVVNRLFTPHMAALVLHIGCFALGAYCLYLLVLHMFGRTAAVITALTYVTWVPLQGAGGWDYHNTLLPTVYFAAYRSLIWATSSNRGTLLKFILFGALCALTIHTNLLSILVLPTLLIRFTYTLHHRPAQNEAFSIRDAAAGFVSGSVAITAVLGIVNEIAGRGFFFWNILVSRSVFLVEHPVGEKSWWLPWSDPWWMSDIGTPLFTAVLILIVVRAGVSWRKWSIANLLGSSAACAMLEFIVAFGIYAAVQTVGHPVLTPFYMAVPLALLMFIAFGAVVCEWVSDSTGIAFVIFAALAFGVQFVLGLSLGPDLFHWHPGTWGSDMPPVLVTLAGFAIAGAVQSTRSTRVRGVLAAAVLAIAIGQSNTLWPMAPDDRFPYDYRTASCKMRQALLAAVAGADDVLFPLATAGHQVALWYRADESFASSTYCGLLADHVGRALFAMGYGSGGEHFWDPETDKAIPASVFSAISPAKDTVVVITNDPEYLKNVLGELQRQSPKWHESTERDVGGDGIVFQLHIIEGA